MLDNFYFSPQKKTVKGISVCRNLAGKNPTDQTFDFQYKELYGFGDEMRPKIIGADPTKLRHSSVTIRDRDNNSQAYKKLREKL